nr:MULTISPECIES: ABC transporter permease [unclassified Haladaptatus]
MLSGGLWVIVVGTFLGLVAGYKGGKLDTVIMFMSDTLMMLPGLPLLLILIWIVKPESPIVIGLTLSLTGWAGLARAIRSEMLSLREADYVEASRIMGLDTSYILKNDLLPNIMPYVLINLVNSMKGMIFAYMGLSFLGVLPFTNLNWGTMLNNAYTESGAIYSWKGAHWLLAPMLAVMLLSFGLVMFAQGCDRLFNPRVRARHENNSKTDKNSTDNDSPTLMESNY